MAEDIKYVVMAICKWDACELDGFPLSTFGGSSDGSIGFMPVFDDIDKLKAAYPGYATKKMKEIRASE